jgi:hypothetical protein
MTETKEKSIEEILEELSFAFASPEASEFTTYIAEKNYRKAKNMLLKKIAADEATLVINHFKSEIKKKFNLVEMSYEEFNIKFPYTGVNSKQQIVVNYRGEMVSAYPKKGYIYPDGWIIYVGHNEVAIKDVDQIWLVEKK